MIKKDSEDMRKYLEDSVHITFILVSLKLTNVNKA